MAAVVVPPVSPRLSMNLMAAAKPAVFLVFHSTGMCTSILRRGVVTATAFLALECNLFSRHGLWPELGSAYIRAADIHRGGVQAYIKQ